MFVVLFIILNVMLSALIVRPITAHVEGGRRRSRTGNMEIAEFAETGGDEVSLLAQVVQPHAPQPGKGDRADREKAVDDG